MRRALLFCLLVCGLAAQAQDDEHRPMSPIPKAAPWMTGAQLLRKMSTPQEAHDAELYLVGLYDATERHDWCYVTPDLKPIVKPRPLDLLAMARAELGRLTQQQLKRNAAALLRDIWQEKYPCPTVTECCDG